MGAYGVYPLLLQKERAAAAVRLMLVQIEPMICLMPAVPGIAQNQYNKFMHRRILLMHMRIEKSRSNRCVRLVSTNMTIVWYTAVSSVMCQPLGAGSAQGQSHDSNVWSLSGYQNCALVLDFA